MLALALAALFLASIPALLFFWNLFFYRRTLEPAAQVDKAVSVLIPARNEEKSIGRAIKSVLESRDVDFELIVLDDDSEDNTASIVRESAERDSRVRLISGQPLPAGWCGKQHACAQLARAAKHPYLVFLDADVRLAPSALRRMVAFMDRSGVDLASGVPFQETRTFLERLLIPLIHFVLLGFLPMIGMRRSRHPAYSAGCGQLFIARRESYERMGGHEAVKRSLHDGITLPRAFRLHGMSTDLFDATDLASCRMYHSASGVWHGLAKNAHEGLAAPHVILPMTMLLFCGQILPLLLLLTFALSTMASVVCSIAVTLLYLSRLIGVLRFRQPIGSALLHPLGVALLLSIQWYAIIRQLFSAPPTWKGRSYPVPSYLGLRWKAQEAPIVEANNEQPTRSLL